MSTELWPFDLDLGLPLALHLFNQRSNDSPFFFGPALFFSCLGLPFVALLPVATVTAVKPLKLPSPIDGLCCDQKYIYGKL